MKAYTSTNMGRADMARNPRCELMRRQVRSLVLLI